MHRRRPLSNRVRRGQAVVEFALVGPIFFVVLFGIIQFGVFAVQHASFTFAVRNATRAASIHANEHDADTQVCAALLTSLRSSAASPANLGTVTIFKADDADMNSMGTDNPTAHDAGVCSTAGTFTPLPSATDTYATSWPYGARRVIDPPDPIGVTATYNFKFILPLFGSGATIRDTMILRIEPQCANGTTC